MSRYEDTEQTKNKFGKRVYKTTMYPHIRKRDNDLYITSKDGDRLDVLSNKYYNSADLWWIIAQANHIGKGTLVIEPWLQIRILTEIGEILAELEDLNN